MENKQIDSKMDGNYESSNQSQPISTSEFLDFLKLACRVHESIILKNGPDNEKSFDYNALAQNELVNLLVNLKSNQSPKSNGADDGCHHDKNGNFLLFFQ